MPVPPDLRASSTRARRRGARPQRAVTDRAASRARPAALTASETIDRLAVLHCGAPRAAVDAHPAVRQDGLLRLRAGAHRQDRQVDLRGLQPYARALACGSEVTGTPRSTAHSQVRCRRVGWHVAMSAPTKNRACMRTLAGWGSAERVGHWQAKEAAAGGAARRAAGVRRDARARGRGSGRRAGRQAGGRRSWCRGYLGVDRARPPALWAPL